MARKQSEPIRVTTTLIKRMKAIQAKAFSEGLRKPTYSDIIEIWEAMSSEAVMMAVLTQLWSEPELSDIRAAVATVKAKQKKPSA